MRKSRFVLLLRVPIALYTDAAPALQAVKSLGKNPAGSELIATPANLSALLSLYNTYKDVADASNEALRCVANAMLLVDRARVTFIDKQVGGGEFAVELLEVRISAITLPHPAHLS